MTTGNLIAVAILMLAAGIILVLNFFKHKKSNDAFTITDFIELYGDKIVNVMKDVISIMTINMASFDTKEEYEAAIIRSTIDAMKENGEAFGLNGEVVCIFDTEALTVCIMRVLEKNKIDVFTVLSSEDIATNKKLLDEVVIEALTPATEPVEEETVVTE